ncbi:NAD(P)/FAD-dependent oxidoreductase [Sulfitobacter donghicola]|uniref:Oxidoreductase n=1 Tax=Sulfitobacter donghicola DSW-25 = KCTC 12864 = JCM 14565 TaxID=1300350 RepID=A0A073IJN8_9RHOB|nr:FAD-binding oxidoreductase [Sulfitobacter donghicola]KEJ89974.1 oxidoreductase [Sulfitobacter donghicola DSW-25 = KCTC 12864 = JCM 14565]KIN66896.1 Gamma-glutamylputrescine oxidoreductase [Sulfitobacter donghicola DSW-25 = KCTC 12864 = JCM 14565]
MNLLYANDKRGAYPPSWYAATATPLEPFAPLKGAQKADVCVIGAGYTGLSAALHLAQAGRDVVLLDAQRVGFGASGRNGGQLGSGQRTEQDALERMVGDPEAKKLWDLAEDAKDLVKSLIADHNIECHLKPGVAWTGSSDAEVKHLHDYANHLSGKYGYSQIETLDRAALQSVCPSPDYRGGFLDRGAAHLHPLNYALGLAKAAKAAGVRIHEGSAVHHIDEGAKAIVRTDAGHVEADHVILACNGYLGGLNRKVAARVMPINNFIVATEPLGDRIAEVLPRDVAVADSRFVVNYFRLSHDGRLLFGGGESYGYRFPTDIAAKVRKPMSVVFPNLKDVKIDYAWGGTLGITMKRLPYLARSGKNILSASGYSGHGVGTATHAGKLMALAIQGDSDGFDTLAALPNTPFPGGSAMRSPLLVMAMTWYALRDRLGL